MTLPDSQRTQAPAAQPAGFWIRFVGWIIDYVVLFPTILLVTYPFMADFWAAYLQVLQNPSGSVPPGMMNLGPMYFLGQLVGLVVTWLYLALMESSKFQGTLGKMAIGLKVIDRNGNRISFARATGRTFSKLFLSGICLIGFIMAAFTQWKQGLHDMIAGTYVVRATGDSPTGPPPPVR